MSRPAAYEAPRFRAPIELDLSRNEGRPGPLRLSEAAAGMETASPRYPDTSELRQILADRVGVAVERVLVTAGGDDALMRCFMSLAGAKAVTTTPTFEMIRKYSEQTGVDLVQIEWWDDDFPVADFLDAADKGATVAVVVSPNNPTGSVIDSSDLAALASRFQIVVYDAAYTEFADVDLTPAAVAFENVIVVRTLSKAFGLAGLRVGYAMASPDRIATLEAYGSPFAVSGLSALVAARALGDDDTRLSFVSAVKAERQALEAFLDDLDVASLPSQGNFVLARFDDPEWVRGACAALGVGVRSFAGARGLENWIRISVPGDETDFRRLLATLRTVLAPEAVVFDLDGVLAADSYTDTILRTAASLGVTVTREDVWAVRAEGNANDDWDLTRQLCRSAGLDLPYETVKARFEAIYQGTADSPGLKEVETPIVDRAVIEKVAARFPVAIVTGRPRSDATEFLERFDLADLFGVVVAREDAPMKPDPAPVRLAVDRLGVESAWMLGDTVDDIAAARSAGVLPIGVVAPDADPERARNDLSAAAVVLDTTARLIEVLDAQNI